MDGEESKQAVRSSPNLTLLIAAPELLLVGLEADACVLWPYKAGSSDT